MTALAGSNSRNDDDPERRHAELHRAWRAGDARAANRLIDIYFKRLRVYFLARAQGEHEDLVQETFTRLLACESPLGSFRAFVFGIARNVFHEFLRRRYRLAKLDPFTDSLALVTSASPSSRLAAREELRLLIDALAALELADQDLLELFYWQQLTGPELAELFEVPEGTIRSRLTAARLRLARTFTELAGRPHDIELDPAQLDTWLHELRELLKRSELEPSEPEPSDPEPSDPEPEP